MTKDQMRKFYFAVLQSLADYLQIPYGKEMIHEELKVGFGIKTTTRLEEDRYNYLNFTIELIDYCHGLYFDAEAYKYDQVVFYIDGQPFKSIIPKGQNNKRN